MVRVIQGARYLKHLSDLLSLRIVCLLDETLFDSIIAIHSWYVLSILYLVLFGNHIVSRALHQHTIVLVNIAVLRLVVIIEVEAIARFLIQLLHIKVSGLVLCEVRRYAEVLLPDVRVSKLLNR